jgi:large subunit ribosomal protein L15
MQIKRSKRSRIRAARKTAGHGSKKKHRGSGHRGGKGNSASGKRSSAKIMKVTHGNTRYLGKYGFKTIKTKPKTIQLRDVEEKIESFISCGVAKKEKDTYFVDLDKLGYEKLLSKGKIKLKMNITVNSATENAISMVESTGGKVITKGLNNEENK